MQTAKKPQAARKLRRHDNGGQEGQKEQEGQLEPVGEVTNALKIRRHDNGGQEGQKEQEGQLEPVGEVTNALKIRRHDNGGDEMTLQEEGQMERVGEVKNALKISEQVASGLQATVKNKMDSVALLCIGLEMTTANVETILSNLKKELEKSIDHVANSAKATLMAKFQEDKNKAKHSDERNEGGSKPGNGPRNKDATFGAESARSSRTKETETQDPKAGQKLPARKSLVTSRIRRLTFTKPEEAITKHDDKADPKKEEKTERRLSRTAARKSAIGGAASGSKALKEGRLGNKK
ncbi:uncharacterized protein [Dermacentor albipictus]|uniref:uncharacterized protein isoform X2 n=1 Tax=Dermacentor albipictus TaxID=60249 RepID=UPI0038FC3C40